MSFTMTFQALKEEMCIRDRLFNILIGDMSLVGPRPERPQFVEKFKEEIPRYMIKHQVRPGLTGWAQVNGYRGDTSIQKLSLIHIYYPKINNYGVQYAKGEYILFLNNDTEIQNPDCLEEMLIHCSRPEVGAVGARLFYEDGTIQHVGVIVGLGGIAGHPYAAEAEETLGHMGRVHMIQDLSAVTAACIMVKKKVFFEVGKFEPEYAVAFNDVDLCMKIRKAGYLIVYTPYARLTHYESKSRGLEDSREKVKRFDSEVALFEERWGLSLIHILSKELSGRQM